MSADPHNQRFFSYLSMFTFFMLVLVTGDNYLIMFVGWEGIGISSYLLINFWFTRIQANKSAIKALVVNRVGDMFLSVGFFAIFFVFGNLDYATVFTLAPFINETLLTIIGLLLLFAAMGKSAQIGLHTWLPDAMEGWVFVGKISSPTQTVSPMCNSSCKYVSTHSHPRLEDVSTSVIGAITGCLLGDGSITVRNTIKDGSIQGNARYGMTMKASSLDYMKLLRGTVFSSFKLGPMYFYPNIELPQHHGKTVQQYSFQSASLPFFTQLHTIWYV
jgi:hypothetical protein